MMKKMKRYLAICLCAASVATQCIGVWASDAAETYEDVSVETEETTTEEEQEFETGKVLVTITHEESGLNRTYSAEDFLGVDIENIEYITPLMDEKDGLFNWEKYCQELVLILADNSAQAVLDAVEVLEQNPLVEAVSPNWIIWLDDDIEYETEVIEPEEISFNDGLLVEASLQSTISAVTPNDKFYANQYALKITEINKAWNYSTGSADVKVGVLDCGISASDFYYNSKANENLITGYDFVNDEVVRHSSIGPHGTNVAGIIGAVGNNSVSISGINWRISMVNLIIAFEYEKNGETNIGTTAEYVKKALAYASENDIKIVNISYGIAENGSSYEEAFESYNGLIVLPAGNHSKNLNNVSAAINDLDNVIIVAATDSDDNLASFSSYGNKLVQLAAPGADIYTTQENTTAAVSLVDGTSFSAPMVTGVAALMMSVDETATTYQIKRNILESVDKLDSLSGKTTTGGRLNGLSAVEAVSAQQKYNYKVLIGYSDNPRMVNSFEASCSYNPFCIHYDGAVENQEEIHCKENTAESTAKASTIDVYSSGYFGATSQILVELKFSAPAFSDKEASYYSALLDTVITKRTSNGDYNPQGVIETVLMGDVDQNGKVESADGLEVLQSTVKLVTLDEYQTIAADVDEDGDVDATDSNLILQYVTKSQRSFW